MDELKSALRDYGKWLLAKQLKQLNSEKDRASPENQCIQNAISILNYNSSDEPKSANQTHLKSIFSFVSNPINQHIQTSIFPKKTLSINLDSYKDETDEAIWDSFDKVSKTLSDFETFYNIYKKYAWYIPSFLEGISVFEYFKAIVALSHSIKDDKTLLLVGGDLPGIQDMVYTITSKGAAKSLRGRSFYIQMLCDVILQSVLRELNLPSANVIYSAGGNFKILASSADKDKLEILRKEINNRLLDGHKGELFAVIEWVEMDNQDVVNGCIFSEKVKTLSEKLGISKRGWFAELAKDRYDDIFEPHGKGGSTSASDSEGDKNFCEVCHVEVDEKSRIISDETTKCKQCDSFEDLTKDLDKKYIIIENKFSLQKKVYTKLGKSAWDDIIDSLGYGLKFVDKKLTEYENATIYKINKTDFLEEGEPKLGLIYNFKFIGNKVPKMSDDDVKYIREHYEDDHSGPGDIRNTTVMAECHATGIPRYAVLRMDVDSLSEVFKQPKNMLQTSALSSALSLFFDGWLNRICEKVNDEWQDKLKNLLGENQPDKDKLPYIIYSGGDDLFIVGSWDVMPMLAERIRNDFASYVSKGYVSDEKVIDPCMTISAGITLCHSKFPIYQAAKLAKESLDGAKNRDSNVKKKDAIDFLGVTVGWEEFDEVKELAFELAKLVKVHENEVPRALLTLLKSVADSYKKDSKKCQSSGGIVYGKWMWQLAYGLSRMVERTKPMELKDRIMKVGGNAVDLGKAKQWRMIRHLNLPVRWAEYLTRKGG